MPDIDTSKLEAVNTMLSLIGEAPVNSLTTAQTEDVQLAIRTLDEVDRQVQGLGWHWNTDQKVKITRGSDNKYAWQADWIRFDTTPGKYTTVDIVRRGQFLYDVKNSTDIFALETIEGHAVKYLDWDDLPESARAYTFVRAARIFMNRTIGDEERAGYAADDERRAWHLLSEEESDQSDANIFDSGVPVLVHRPGGGGLLPGVPL